MQDNVNTIGQIFTNYQAALHQFETAIQDGAGEAVPRELAMEVLREAARDVFEPVLRAAAETAGEVADHVEDGIGVADTHPAETPREPRRSLQSPVASGTANPAAAFTSITAPIRPGRSAIRPSSTGT